MTAKILCLIYGCLILVGCSTEINKKSIMKSNILAQYDDSDFRRLENVKIYFGHQSVGFNLIDGVKNELKQNPTIHLNINKLANPLDISPGLTHSQIGKNGRPKSKIDDFKKLIDSGLGEQIDIAGFKFCYADINNETDVNELFSYYRVTMDNLSIKYPKVKFVHFTVPIRTIRKDTKALINKFLGRDLSVKNNHARQKFSNLLIQHYSENSIFDLAKTESTFPNGERQYVIENNETIYSMVNEYSNDGGHLSEYGKKQIGSQFLIFLINKSNGR